MESDAIAEHVCARIQGIAAHLLGSHVRGTSSHRVGRGRSIRARGGENTGEAEIGHAGATVTPDQHVLRLEVTVQDAGSVGRRQPARGR